MLTLYGSSAKKYYFFEDEIRRKIENGKADYMALLPVNRAVRLLKRRLTDAAPGRTIIDAGIFTFNELLLKIYNNLPDAKRVIQTETQRLFISHILKTRKDEFAYFPVKTLIPESSAVKIADIAAELRRFGYSAKRFEKIELDSSAKKQDFHLLLNYLEKALQPGLIDEPFALYTAAEKLEKSVFSSLFPQVTDIYISGYELFTPAMKRFVENAKDWLNIYLKLTYNEKNEAAFRHVNDAWGEFAEMADTIIKDENPTPLSLYLMNRAYDNPAAEKPRNRYFINKLKNRKEEIEFIAALAKQLNQRENIPLHRIAVTFANLERYVPLIRSVFAEYGLPCNLSTGFKLNQSPLIQTFVNILKFITCGYESKKALELINNRFIKIEERLKLAALFKYIARYRIEYLSDNSLKKLKELLIRDGADDKEIDIVNKLAAFLHPFFTFTPKDNIAGLRNAFIALLKDSGLLDWYKTPVTHLTESDREKEFRAYNRFMKVFDKFVWSFTQINAAEIIELNDFIRLLQSQINNASYSLSEKTDYGVQINPRLEIQAISFDVLIIGGLIDGEFPRESVKDVFFNDTVRKKMGLVATENLLDQDRFIFYSLLDSAAERIYMTYPQYDAERLLPPSTFIADFLELYPASGEYPDFDKDYMLTEISCWNLLGENIFNKQKDEAAQMLELLINTGGEKIKPALKSTLRHIDAQQLRINGNKTSVFEGQMSGSETIEEILHKKYDNMVWSASRLEEYAFCPMQFFYRQILKIEEWPEIEEEFTPLERGNLLHTVLYRFYSEIPDKRRPADYEKKFLEIAEEELERLPYSGLFAKLEKIRYCGTETNDGFLSYYLNYDQEEINKTGFRPAYFELAFGGRIGRNSDPSSTAEPLTIEADGKKLRLQGRIDRVDINENGAALIFDYKTGTSAKYFKPSDVAEGLIFQLPLYMSALPQLLDKYSADFGGYYIIKDKKNCLRYALIADKNSASGGKPKTAYLPAKGFENDKGEEYTLDEVLRINVKQALKKAQEIIKGNFRHSLYPDNKSCQSYCEFRRMCHKNSAKMKRMAEKQN